MMHDREPPLDVDGISPGLAIWLKWLGGQVSHLAEKLDGAVAENARSHAELKAEMCKITLWRKEIDTANHDEKVKAGVWRSQGKGLVAGVGIATAVLGLARALGVL